MVTILPMQNKNFTGDEKEFTKVHRAVTKAESSLYGHFIGTRQVLWRFIVESSHFNTSSIRDEWYCWKSRSIATIGIGWKTVRWFSGMLLLFAKCPRPPGRCENSLWKTFWRSIQRANNSFWSNGRISPDFTTRSVRTSSTWQESSIWDLSWVWADRGRNLERRYSDCGIGRFGKVGRIRIFILERAKQKLLRKHKGAYESSSSRHKSRKFFTLTILWNVASLVWNFPRIIVRRHHTDQKQMGLLKEQCAEWKKVRLQYCCNQVWMKNGGQIPWNVTPICETSQISCLMGTHHMKGGLECPFTDQ